MPQQQAVNGRETLAELDKMLAEAGGGGDLDLSLPAVAEGRLREEIRTSLVTAYRKATIEYGLHTSAAKAVKSTNKQMAAEYELMAKSDRDNALAIRAMIAELDRETKP